MLWSSDFWKYFLFAADSLWSFMAVVCQVQSVMIHDFIKYSMSWNVDQTCLWVVVAYTVDFGRALNINRLIHVLHWHTRHSSLKLKLPVTNSKLANVWLLSFFLFLADFAWSNSISVIQDACWHIFFCIFLVCTFECQMHIFQIMMFNAWVKIKGLFSLQLYTLPRWLKSKISNKHCCPRHTGNRSLALPCMNCPPFLPCF